MDLHHPVNNRYLSLMNGKPSCEHLRLSLSPTATFLQESSTQENSPMEPSELIRKFHSYATNISRTRKGIKSITVTQQDIQGDMTKKTVPLVPSPASLSAIRSLIYMMNNEINAMDRYRETLEFSDQDHSSLVSTLNRAIIQAIRASSDNGDYNMITKLVNTTIEYANGMKQLYGIHILDARIFGEAITEMSNTKASYSKLKRLWTLMVEVDPILFRKPTSYELNSIISAHIGRRKVRGALDFHQTHGQEFGRDEFTASALMNLLADSITFNEPDITKDVQNHTTGVSPCWQWNEAEILMNDFERLSLVNNQVYASALKVNEKAMELYRTPGNRHYGAKIAMSIFKRMQARKICPDVITCSAVMSAFDKGKQWRAAKALLFAMEKTLLNNTEIDDSEWTLPAPNVFTYASAISSCARCSEFEEALEIVDRMRDISNNCTIEGGVSPNRWVYNSALAACVPPSQNWLGNYTDRFHTAVEILRRMEEDALNGHDTTPDTISYNTALAAVTGLAREVSGRQSTAINDDDFDTSVQLDETMIEQLMDEMTQKGIKKDHITYRNAIIACRSNPEAALRLLDRALVEKGIANVPKTVAESGDEIREYLINAAISVCASNGRIDLITKLFAYFQQYRLVADSRTMIYLVKGLSRSEHDEDAMILLNAMKGDGVANSKFLERHKINVIASGNITSEVPMIQEGHYSAAIAGSLRRGKLFQALKILNAMKLHGLTPNDSSLRGIIIAYCKLATDEATHEYRLARREYASKTQTKGPLFKANTDVSRSRVEAALSMMQGLKIAPIRLQCVVASACAATGMWDEAKELLWKIHIAAVLEKKSESTVEANNIDQGSALAELPKLHRSLLKLCARSGNIRAALWYTDAIQDLRLKLEGNKHRERTYSSDRKSSPTDPTDFEVIQSWDSANLSLQHGIGMSGEDWKLLMITASKSAHWKVCLGTLPFIQPFVEATHPRHASKSADPVLSLKTLNKEYDKLSRALTAAILAFEIRSQYAWAVRAIDDWIEWSGRRPPKEAMFSACRVLSSRGQGGQVTALVNRVLRMEDYSKASKKNISYETSYEMALYVEAITALVNNGLYDSADELYLEALSRGFLPFTIIERTPNKQLKLDLHGMSRATAHSAVRVALQHLVQSSNGEKLNQDILIVTGKGKRSEKHLRPVLRPEVQRMLMEEFYPPISTSSIPKNTGALKVSSGDVNAWLEYQKQQRGVRFLAVADILKTITMGTRLKKILAENLKDKQ